MEVRLAKRAMYSAEVAFERSNDVVASESARVVRYEGLESDIAEL